MIFLILAFAALWRLGGWDKGYPFDVNGRGWGSWRDFFIPFLTAVAIGVSHQWWLGVLMFFSSNIIRMGDGNWSPNDDDTPSFFGWLTKDTTGRWTKALHGLVSGLIAPLPLVIFGVEGVVQWLLFAVGFGVISWFLRASNNVWLDESTRGAFFTLVVLP